MGQVYHYREFIDKNKIYFQGNIENKYRYLLKIPLKSSENKKILVIMKNPSKANKYISDLTIDRVLTFCHDEGYSEVNIMNLYSYYSSSPKEIGNLIENGEINTAIGEDNDNIMINLMGEINDVIVAWGTNTFNHTKEYKNRIKQVIDIIKDKNLYYVESISGKGWYPRHAQVWSVKSGIQKYKWKPPAY